MADRSSLERLLRAVALNVILGNGDAHGKNFSLLHAANGVLSLSPLCDLMCTLHYDDNRLAMSIDNVARTDQVTVQHIVNEAVSWGMRPSIAMDVVRDLLERVSRAIGVARDQASELPAAVVACVTRQLKFLNNT